MISYNIKKQILEKCKNKPPQAAQECVYGKYGNGRYEKIEKLYNARNTIVYSAKDCQTNKK